MSHCVGSMVGTLISANPNWRTSGEMPQADHDKSFPKYLSIERSLRRLFPGAIAVSRPLLRQRNGNAATQIDGN
jgi:hypothetical protein